MSRIGKRPIPIPQGVTISFDNGAVEVRGPKGTLRPAIPANVHFEQEEETLVAKEVGETSGSGQFQGLARSLVANAVAGVCHGFKKELDIVGVGYRAEVKDRQVHFALGYSHPVVFDIPDEIEIAIERNTHLVVSGIDKQRVGQVAANIRALRKPDPYKQKGIRYTGEVLKKKVGKTGA